MAKTTPGSHKPVTAHQAIADLLHCTAALGTTDAANLAAILATLGATTGASVVTDANGTIQQYLRGLVKSLIPVLGAISGAAVVTDANGSVQQYLRGLVKALIPVLGATNGAAVVTDADGSIHQYLRGLVKIFADLYDSTQHGLKIADDANIADSAGIQQAEAGVAILDVLWHQVSTANLTIGKRYELQLYSTIPSDTGLLRWVTRADAVDPAAAIGRIAFLHQPIIIVPATGHVRLYVKTVTLPATYGNGVGYYAALEPCEL